MIRQPRGAAARWCAPLAAALLALIPVALVHADIGVAMDVGKVAVDQRLAKGGTYHLPVIGVRNPGTEAATYEMGVSHIQGQAERWAPDSWFSFSPSRFTLQPGATQPVRVTLDIPTDAGPDDYAVLLQARIAPAGEGAQVGAAAAAQLSFTVKPSTILEAWLLRGRRTIADWSPWSYVLPALLAGGVTVRWLSHRYRLGLRLERRS
jgi:hypothetical protein